LKLRRTYSSFGRTEWAGAGDRYLHGWVYGLKDSTIKPVFEMKAGTPIDEVYRYENP
jgi:hypothetical protein